MGTTPKYNDEDFIAVLTKKPVITRTVLKRLQEKDELYENIHYDTVRKTLIRLLAEKKIGGGRDEETGIYMWNKK